MTLADSLAELRDRGQTLDDFKAWLYANPEALPGLARTFHHQNYEIGISYRPANVLPHLRYTETLQITVSVEYKLDFEVAPELEIYASAQGFNSSSDKLTRRYEFELPLKDWPLATAIVVAAHFEYSNYQTASAQQGKQLDKLLDKHFPGMTLEKISQLHRADLLAINDEEDPGHASLIQLLFSTRNNNPGIGGPSDLTP